MGLPPVISEAARRAALLEAVQARKVRAEIKSKVKQGQLSFDEVLKLALENRVISKMRVKELLESFTGVGRIRSATLMERLNISPTRRIRGLGKHQIQKLRKEFAVVTTFTKRGKLLVLSGPGGVGKSTVASLLREKGSFWVSISATTRQPRPEERDGVDYFFLSQEEFSRRVAADEFLEWATFAGAQYGTPQGPVLEALNCGRDVLLEIEIAGAKQVKAHLPSALLIFLEPPSWEELVARLKGRGSDSPERRAQRLELAQEELAAAASFDLVIVNTLVDSVVSQLIELASS